MTDEPKPCCCGMVDQFVSVLKTTGSDMSLKYFVSCGDCGRTVEADDYQECVRHWNTRPIEDALVKALEEARHEIHALDRYDAENNPVIKRIDDALALAKGVKNAQ